MDKIAGFLIRYHRLQQNISQDGLCKGICVVSYVSKIEQGKVEANDEIIHQLFQVLGISYCNDENFINKGRKMLKQYYDKKRYRENVEEEENWLSQHSDSLLHSPLCIAYRLYLIAKKSNDKQYNIIDEHVEELALFEPCMEDEERYQYYLSYASHSKYEVRKKYILQAGKLKDSDDFHYACGHMYLSNGEFFEAIEHLQKAYDMYSNTGNVYGMLYTCVLLGDCYACQNVEALMMKYYKIGANLARNLKDKKEMRVLYYNIGATYLELKRYDIAEEYLSQCMHTNDDVMEDVFYCNHKLALLYIETNRKEKGLPYVKKLQSIATSLQKDAFLKISEFIVLRYEDNYLQNKRYAEVLQEICKLEDSLYFGFRLFHARYYVEVLQHQRRYKEAFHILQETENRYFPVKIK